MYFTQIFAIKTALITQFLFLKYFRKNIKKYLHLVGRWVIDYSLKFDGWKKNFSFINIEMEFIETFMFDDTSYFISITVGQNRFIKNKSY